MVRLTFVISTGLGLASMFMHDAAAVSIGIVTMLPLMRAADIKPCSNTAKFMLISLGLAMGYSGAADYFANIFFPLTKGGGWLLLFIGVAIFGALVTNAMANVAAAALILPIVIPMAQLEGVNPAALALCLGTATSFAMLLVISCPPNAIAYSFR